MMIKRASFLSILLLLAFGTITCVNAGSVSQTDAQNWIRYTVPLPKAISIDDSLTLGKRTIAISAPSQPDQVTAQAVKELTQLVGAPKGRPAFAISLILGGSDSTPLNDLKNSDQAYRIIPQGTGGLKLVALSPRGLYYAAKTLQQLIAAKATKKTVQMPILTVTDWPDMEDRGLWGSDNFAHLKWMGDRKMNIVEQISDQGVKPNGMPYAKLKAGRETISNQGPLYGIKGVPATLHLEQVSGKGIFAAYPNLKAKSEKQGAWCYSQPQAPVIIGGWITDLASLPNVNEVDVWMSENMNNIIGCQCDLCKATGVNPMVLEARAIVRGWQIARRRTGRDIGLRILTSEATEDYNKQILAELPKGVKVWYYHSLLTYTTGRQPMLRQYLADFANDGGWMGVCPNVSPCIGFSEPMCSAQFIHYRINEFLSKGARGIIGYATPRVHYAYYNVEAEAEYTWNLNGRSTREFAASYAVRNGIKDPEKFADFAEAVGQVEWDTIGSDWPSRAENWQGEPMDVRIKKGTVPDLGFVLWDFIRVPFGNIENEQRMAELVASAQKAVDLANEMGIAEYKQEARVAHGYMMSLKALHELKGLVKNGQIAPQDKDQATKCFQMYVDSLREANDALPKWERIVRRPTDPGDWTSKDVNIITEKIIKPTISTAAELGVTIK